MITKFNTYLNLNESVKEIEELISIDDFKKLISNNNKSDIIKYLTDFIKRSSYDEQKLYYYVSKFLDQLTNDELIKIKEILLYDIYMYSTYKKELHLIKLFLTKLIEPKELLFIYEKLANDDKLTFFKLIVSSYSFNYYNYYKFFKQYFYNDILKTSSNLKSYYIGEMLRFILRFYYSKEDIISKKELYNEIYDLINLNDFSLIHYDFYQTLSKIKNEDVLQLMIDKLKKEFGLALHKKYYEYFFKNLILTKNYNLVLFAYNQIDEKLHKLNNFSRRELVSYLNSNFKNTTNIQSYINQIINLFLKDTKLTFNQFLNINLSNIKTELKKDLNLKEYNIIDELFECIDDKKNKLNNFNLIKVLFSKYNYSYYLKIIEYIKKYDYYKDFKLLILCKIMEHRNFKYEETDNEKFVEYELYNTNFNTVKYLDEFIDNIIKIKKKLFSFQSRNYYSKEIVVRTYISTICNYIADKILEIDTSNFNFYKNWITNKDLKIKYDYLFNAKNFDII